MPRVKETLDLNFDRQVPHPAEAGETRLRSTISRNPFARILLAAVRR